MTIDLIWQIAHDLIGAACDVLGEAGQAVPDRVFVDVNDPPLAPLGESGCESQIAIGVIGPTIASAPQLNTTASNPRGPCALVWAATFPIVLSRCYEPAAHELPSPAEVDIAGREHLRDGWQLARGMGYRWARGTLVPSLGEDQNCSSIRFLDMRSLGPQGGIRAWRLPIQVLLPGTYDPQTGE